MQFSLKNVEYFLRLHVIFFQLLLMGEIALKEGANVRSGCKV